MALAAQAAGLTRRGEAFQARGFNRKGQCQTAVPVAAGLAPGGQRLSRPLLARGFIRWANYRDVTLNNICFQGFAANRTALIAAALESYLNKLEEQEIDRQFAVLADDDESRQLYENVAGVFDNAAWEALLLGEDEA